MASKLVVHFCGVLFAMLVPVSASAADTVVNGLDYPWHIEAHGGKIYVTEKSGTVGILAEGSFTRLPVETSQPILDDRGGGLLGLAISPDFPDTGRIVLYQHYGTPDARMNRVIEAERLGARWKETRVLIDAIPGHPLYNGGRVAFGPDGMLYVTTGWTENRERPQSHIFQTPLVDQSCLGIAYNIEVRVSVEQMVPLFYPGRVPGQTNRDTLTLRTKRTRVRQEGGLRRTEQGSHVVLLVIVIRSQETQRARITLSIYPHRVLVITR